MKLNSIHACITAVAALAATGCTSYEIDMPANPAEPVAGPEVSSQVFYQANPRFFADNNCLQAVDAQLPRISGMGCDILWLMPVLDPGQEDAIGSPYCVRDFKTLNPRYGSIDDLHALVDHAHSLGMAVVLDWIANHTAWDCPWISEHPDWYQHDADGNIVSPEGWPDVAQLNWDNADMRAAMKDAMLYWVESTGIDGYRCDYADGVPHDFWNDLIASLRQGRPDFIMLAESADPAFYDDGFNLIYDWDCSTTLSKIFNGGKPSEAVKEASTALAKVPEGKSILRYVFNHDVAAENDVATMYGTPEGTVAAYVAAAMLGGTPMVYSSMDVEGLKGRLSFFDYRPLDFSTTLSDRYGAINKAFATSAEVRRGELADFSTSSVICFTRAIPGHNLLVAVNTTDSEQTVKTPITLAGATMTDLIEGTSTAIPVVLTLEAYSYSIFMN